MKILEAIGMIFVYTIFVLIGAGILGIVLDLTIDVYTGVSIIRTYIRPLFGN